MEAGDPYDAVIGALRATGIEARLEGAATGAMMIMACHRDREVRITDLDPPLPENPQNLTGWWVGVYQLDADGHPLTDSPGREEDFAPEDVAGLVTWTANVLRLPSGS
ncbi:hypothetical protein [Streptomyces sp. SBT349]|uniref:hypothetical protein n=1 Tax=Streptomyces sp. SBT349 TaxID=1580539 RepID=UPI00066E64DE|nr:hypothetical protein [Streptomyces sp. SBT349]